MVIAGDCRSAKRSPKFDLFENTLRKISLTYYDFSFCVLRTSADLDDH